MNYVERFFNAETRANSRFQVFRFPFLPDFFFKIETDRTWPGGLQNGEAVFRDGGVTPAHLPTY